MYLFWKSDCHCHDWYGPNMTPWVPPVTLNIQCLNKTIAQRRQDGWWGSVRSEWYFARSTSLHLWKHARCSQKRQFKGRYETFVMLKHIRTFTRSTSVEVYDRAIAMTVEEHCLDFTAHFDSVCTVSVKNIRTVLNFVCRTSFSNKKKKTKWEQKICMYSYKSSE